MAKIDLFHLSVKDKQQYLSNNVYKKITISSTGRTMISTDVCRKVAIMLGGDYNSLSKIQKTIFKSTITNETIDPEGGIGRRKPNEIG